MGYTNNEVYKKLKEDLKSMYDIEVDEVEEDSQVYKNVESKIDNVVQKFDVPESGLDDIPESLGLTKYDEIETTNDDVEKQVISLLESKYGKLKADKVADNQDGIKSMNLEKVASLNKKAVKDETVNRVYDNYSSSAETQALKRGLARSSIVINQLDGIEKNRADELIVNANQYQNELDNIEKSIIQLSNSLEDELQLMELDKASETETLIASKINELDKKKKEIIDFNNEVDKLEAQYKKSRSESILKQQLDILENNDDIEKIKKQRDGEIIKTVTSELQKLGRIKGLTELVSNPKYVELLGGNAFQVYVALCSSN